MDDATSFLAAETAGWSPFTALAELSDADLERSVEDAHGWSGRDLIAHLVFWQEIGARIVRDLEIEAVSSTRTWVDAEWEADGDGWNDRILVEWRALPLGVVRSRFAAAPAALRAALDAAPASRWWGDDGVRRDLISETVDHYADHLADLDAILAAADR